jgi:hypothetical protein
MPIEIFLGIFPQVGIFLVVSKLLLGILEQLPKGNFVEASLDIFPVGLSTTFLRIFCEVGIFPELLLGIFLDAH